MDNNNIRIYLRQISCYPLLTPQEELKLATGYAYDKDPNAWERLIVCNLRYVITLAKKYESTKLSLDDLIQAGNEGLITAVKRFDHHRGFRLITYATWWIRQSILKYIADQSRLIRLPANKNIDLSRYRSQLDTLSKNLNRAPALTEIQDELGKKVDTFEMLHGGLTPLSLYDSNHDGIELKDIIKSEEPGPEYFIQQDEKLKYIETLIRGLDPREKDIVRLYYGIGDIQPLTLEEIGNLFNITRERVRQIKKVVLERLSNDPNPKLKEYIDEI